MKIPNFIKNNPDYISAVDQVSDFSHLHCNVTHKYYENLNKKNFKAYLG
jgi:hypothetical protein